MAQQIRRSTYATGSLAHAQRVAYSGGNESVKTIKFPTEMQLKADSPEILNGIAEAIMQDDIAILGARTEYSHYYLAQQGKEVYSALDFWIDAVRLGMVFAQSAASLLQTVGVLSNAQTPIALMLGQSSVKELLNMHGAESFLAKRTFGKGSSVSGVSKNIIKCFVQGHITEEAAEAKAKKLLALGPAEQKQYKKQLLGIAGIAQPEGYRNTLGITACLLPGFETPDAYRAGRDVTLLYHVQRMQRLLSLDEVKEAYEFVGMHDSALSNFLNGNSNKGFLALLLRGEFDTLARGMMDMTPLWNEHNHDVLMNRLQALGRNAQKLSFTKPRFGNSFADHRKQISGKATAWFSGYCNKLDIAKEQIPLVLEDAKMFMEMLCAVEIDYEKEEFMHLQLSAFIERMERAHERLDADGVVALKKAQYVLPIIREFANPIVQREEAQQWLSLNIELVPDKRFTFKQAFPYLSDQGGADTEKGEQTKFQSVPRFFAEGAHAEYVAFSQAPMIFSVYMENLRLLWDRLIGMERRTPRNWEEHLSKLLYYLYVDIYVECRTDACKKYVRGILETYAHVSRIPEHVPGIKRFTIKPGYTPQGGLTKDQLVQCVLQIAQRLSNAGFEWKRISALERLDLVEVHKKAFAFLVGITHGSVDVSAYNWLNNKSVVQYLDVLKTTDLGGIRLARFLQSCVCATLRGSATRMSEQMLTARFSVQTATTIPQCELVYAVSEYMRKRRFVTPPSHVSRDVLDRKPASIVAQAIYNPEQMAGSMRFIPHRFGYQIQLPELARHESLNNALVVQKPTSTRRYSFARFDAEKGPVLWVESSHYQQQYFDWFFFAPNNRPADVIPQGVSLVVEQDIALQWDFDALVVHMQPVHEPRMYCPQPFKFVPRVESSVMQNRYMGIAPGTNEVAYAVIEVNGTRVSVINCGTFPLAGFANLSRAEEKKQKRERRVGSHAFSPDKRAIVLDNSANKLANQIHACAIQNRARLVWQWTPQTVQIAKGREVDMVYARARKSCAPKNDSDFDAMKTKWGKIWSAKWEDGKHTLSTEVYYAESLFQSACNAPVPPECATALMVALLGRVRDIATPKKWEDDAWRADTLAELFQQITH